MTIAVIIPVFNEEAALPRLLKELLSKGFDEIIVVDGGAEIGRLKSRSHF